MKYLKIFGVLSVILYPGMQCYALQQEVKNTPHFVFNNWSLKEGLPQSSVNDLIQTRDGYIWIATWGGLARFDGVSFTVFSQTDYPELGSDRILRLFEDSNETLWIVTEEGLISKNKNIFTAHSGKNGLPAFAVDFIHEDDVGRIFILNSEKEFYFFKNDRWEQDENSPDFLLATIFSAAVNDNLYIATQNELYIRDKSGWNEQNINLDILKDRPTSLAEDINGDTWISTNGNGIFIFSENSYKHIREEGGLISNFVHNLFRDSAGNIWVLTRNGISIWNGEQFTSITSKNGLSENQIKRMIEDHEGTFWIGTETGGLNKMRPAVIQVIGKNNGFSQDNLLSIAPRKDGSIIIGSNCFGLYEYREGNIAPLQKSAFLSNQCIWSVLEDENETLWVGSSGLTAFKKDGNIQHYNKSDGLNALSVKVLYEDDDKSLWVGSGGGLNHFQNNSFTSSITTANGLSNNDVRVVFRDSRQDLWVGTSNGLNKITGDEITAYTSIPGLSNHYIRFIYEDEEGYLWFGSYGGGLILYREDEFTVFTQKDGLFDNIISHIVEDEFGFFWMGSNRGIARTARSQILDFADGKAEKIISTSYGAEHGLINPETNGGFQPSIVTTEDGKIFFPTVAGLAIVDPAVINLNQTPPPVRIENINLNSSSLQYLDSVKVDWRLDMLEIQYTALSFVDPALVNFQYKLDNYDEDWIDAGTRRSAFYTGLPPGEYTFMLTAENNDGVKSEAAATLPITIIPPFWMTGLFQFLIAFLLTLAGIALYAKRINTLKRKQKRQEEVSTLLIEKQEEERTRIAGEMHDSLGQLLLVLKNKALQQLRKVSTDPQTKIVLEEMSDDVSKTLKTVREISHNLRPPELDRLGITETLRALLDDISTSVLFTIHSEIESIDGLIPKEKEINFIRIVQEAFNNIIKHAEASHIEIHLSVKSNNIILTVRDNGQGFDSHNSGTRHTGLGFTTLSERVRILRGTYNLESYPGKGTLLTVIIPVL